MVSAETPRGPVSMLLVEDEKETLDVVAATLAMKYPGVALYSADTGAIGVEMFAAHLPDIVITDINMPNMNGVQMISTIRVLKPATKFIVLTADSRKRTSATSVGDGVAVDHCLLKPVKYCCAVCGDRPVHRRDFVRDLTTSRRTGHAGP